MKGIIRKFDAVGRIVVPAEIRQSLGMYNGTLAEMTVENDAIMIRKVNHVDYLIPILGGIRETIVRDISTENQPEMLKNIDALIDGLKEAKI